MARNGGATNGRGSGQARSRRARAVDEGSNILADAGQRGATGAGHEGVEMTHTAGAVGRLAEGDMDLMTDHSPTGVVGRAGRPATMDKEVGVE